MAGELQPVQVARVVADTALATEGVHSLGTGSFAEVATYGAGEKVLGVIATEDRVEVHIVALYPLRDSVPKLADKIRERILPEVGSRRVDVVVEDVALANEEAEGVSGDEGV